MFIERLTKEQVDDFLNERYPKKFYQHKFGYHEELKAICGRAKCYNDRDEFDSFRLRDFDVLFSIYSKDDWIKYLYKIFGEEYKEAYLADCAKVFE